jgi:hypothetical protein
VNVYIIVIVAALAFTGGWKVESWRWDASEKANLEAAIEKRRMDEKNVDVAAAGHEADKTKLRTKYITITKEVERVAQTPFYAASAPACLDDDGLRQLRAAIASRPAASEPAGAVSGPRGAHWWNTAGDAPLVH